jgi:hypothetical protein
LHQTKVFLDLLTRYDFHIANQHFYFLFTMGLNSSDDRVATVDLRSGFYCPVDYFTPARTKPVTTLSGG